MLSTDARVALAKARAREIEQRRKRRLLLAALASSAALALVVIRQGCVLLRPTKGSV